MNPRHLDKVKRKLRRVYETGSGPVSISVNSIMEVFLWCARTEDPLALSSNILSAKSAIYVAYESKIGKPTAGELLVSLEVDEAGVYFESGDGRATRSWARTFKGIYVRAIEYGDLPCEDFSSCCMRAENSVRDFRLIGKVKFSDKYHFEPIRLTLEARQ